MNTPLNNRTLWYDGDSSYNSEQLSKAIYSNPTILNDCWVTLHDDDIIQYQNERGTLLKIKKENKPFDSNLLPEVDTKFDWREYISDCFFESTSQMTDNEIVKRFQRLELEMDLIEQLNKVDYIYTLIHIVKKLTTNQICWNARGSSSASYVLYVIGVHFIDSFKYNIDPIEFFKVELL